MTYLRAEIEDCPAYGWQAKPSFKTLLVTMANGRERRNADQAYARHSYSVPFLNIDPVSYRGIKQMHYVCRGMVHCFQFVDELDNQATNELFATGDGTTKVFQLAKISTISGVSYNRNVYVIRNGYSITDNGSAVTPTVDQDRGTVTFASAPANGHALRWSGSFALWVRFNQDDLPFSLDNLNAVNGTIDLIEVPPPEIGE
jgi:uncharacterized protein (TIGR02217 family)